MPCQKFGYYVLRQQTPKKMNIIASYLVSSFFLVYSFSGLVTISSRNELHANKHNRKECNYGLESGSWKDGNNGDRWEVLLNIFFI